MFQFSTGAEQMANGIKHDAMSGLPTRDEHLKNGPEMAQTKNNWAQKSPKDFCKSLGPKWLPG